MSRKPSRPLVRQPAPTASRSRRSTPCGCEADCTYSERRVNATVGLGESREPDHATPEIQKKIHPPGPSRETATGSPLSSLGRHGPADSAGLAREFNRLR
jgi:hypothetical protein